MMATEKSPATPTDEPIRLTAGVQVQPGSIVSRKLVDQSGVRQTLFALDADQNLRDHSVPVAATVLVLDGKLDFTLSGTTHTLSTGDWLFMPPGSPHALTARAPTHFVLTLFPQAPS